MLKYLNSIPNQFVDNLNLPLMRREFDKELHEFVYMSFLGFSIIPNIKILGYEWDPNEENYNVNDHVIRRNSNKNKIIKNMAETRCGVLYLDVEISAYDKSGDYKVYYIKKPIIIPIQDEHGYYKIKGKSAYILFQLVDKLSYPSIGAVTVKSLMPISVKTFKEELVDVNHQSYTVPIYKIQIFKNAINVLLIYSHLTITKMLNFLEVYRFIKILAKDDYSREEGYLYFECNKKSNIVVAVQAEPFEEFIYVRSITGCLLKLFEEYKIAYHNIDNRDEWMIIVGGKNTIRRGEYQHIFFNRLLDDVTRAELKINDYDKQNIYYLLRWILQNYHTLWAKDNLSMVHKRLR